MNRNSRTGAAWGRWALILILILLGAVVVFSSSSAVAPFLYPFL